MTDPRVLRAALNGAGWLVLSPEQRLALLERLKKEEEGCVRHMS